MFKAVATTETLEQFVDTAHALVGEAKIHLHDNTLRLAAIDPANVAMVEQTLGAAAFESYETDGGVIGVNLNRLGDVLSMGDAQSLVHLELDEDTGKLQIDKVGGLSYTLALIDPDTIQQEPDIPNLDTAGTATVEGRDLDRAVTACDLASDHMALGFDADAGELYADASGDTDDVHFALDGKKDLLDGKFERSAETLLSLNYMNDLKKPISADTEVELELGNSLPVKIHYGYADGGGVVTNMVAPRIQSD